MKATGRDIEVRGYIESIVRLDDINTLDIRHECGCHYHCCCSESSLRQTRQTIAHAGLHPDSPPQVSICEDGSKSSRLMQFPKQVELPKPTFVVP